MTKHNTAGTPLPTMVTQLNHYPEQWERGFRWVISQVYVIGIWMLAFSQMDFRSRLLYLYYWCTGGTVVLGQTIPTAWVLSFWWSGNCCKHPGFIIILAIAILLCAGHFMTEMAGMISNAMGMFYWYTADMHSIWMIYRCNMRLDHNWYLIQHSSNLICRWAFYTNYHR